MLGVTLDPETCYRALVARDRRFDGVFFVAVKTTGIYCRPICPARTPGRDRCAFFARAAEAEHAGYRACFRCRPELAPGVARVDAIGRLVRAAASRIDAGVLDDASVDELAVGLGVTGRHLRRAMEAELGISPIAYAQTRRLALAKQLLHDTTLPLAEVALGAGFASIRRFNAAFRERFEVAPSEVRRAVGVGAGPARSEGAIALRLDYRPPLDWAWLLSFLGARAVPGVELVDAERYARTVRVGELRGRIDVTRDARREGALIATVSLSLLPRLAHVVSRLRALFDLDAEPRTIAEQLGRDPALAGAVRARPGLRVPGCFDPFEMMVRAVLGQQVSVRGATTLAGRLARRFGSVLPERVEGAPELAFPSAEELSRAHVSAVREIGLPEARAETLVSLAKAVATGAVDPANVAEPEAFVAALQSLRGIGPWTANYVAMRALRWPDAFPAGDLGVQKALGVKTAKAAEDRSRAWQPWRAYAVMHLWTHSPKGART